MMPTWVRHHSLSSSTQLSRRNFIQTLGALGAGFGAAVLTAPRVFAQQNCSSQTYFPPDYPVNCAPPTPSGPPVPFTPLDGPALPRKSAFELSDPEIARLTTAYQALRDLTTKDPSDPRGWLQQGHVHCWYCGGGSDGAAGPEIHQGWWFLPWHRAYLYFYERILGQLIGDPTFRLPYWDWDTQNATPSHQTMPPVYTLPPGSSNPMVDLLRGRTPTQQIGRHIVGPAVIQRVLGQTTFATFGGEPPQPNYGGGQLEAGPHNGVHNWSGTDGNKMPTCGTDMGVLGTAAQDPIFFAHHSNIDRFWGLWKAQGGGRTNPTDSSWLNQSWTFYDEQKRWVSIMVKDVLDTTALGYTYAPVQPSMVAVTPPSPQGARQVATEAQAPARLKIASQPSGIKLGTKPKTHVLSKLPELLKQNLAQLSAEPQKRYILRIHNITVPPTQAVQVLVFVNQPKANASTSLDTPNFVGTIGAVPHHRSAQAHHQTTFGAAIELPPSTLELIRKEQRLTVTLVPVDANGREPKNLSLTYTDVSLEMT